MTLVEFRELALMTSELLRILMADCNLISVSLIITCKFDQTLVGLIITCKFDHL